MDEKGREQAVGRLQHNYLLSPITALSFHRDASGRLHVLAAEDTWLKVFDVATNQLLGQLKVFYSQPIHGIYSSESANISTDGTARVLIWGGQSVAVLSHLDVQSLINRHIPSPPTELRVADWIYDGILFPSTTTISGTLVTAHNEIIPITTSASGEISFGPLTSPSRPILYSANLTLLSPDCILVAGGTVFGEIIVWKYYLDPARPSQWELLFVFTGHEGSIFGVSISPEMEVAPGVKARLLASCSDDRTIRIWDIAERDVAANSRPGMLGDARETGFGANSEVNSAHEEDSKRCVAVAMGHISRIWHVKFSGRVDYTSPAGPVEVFSFGEDCSRQRWELELDWTADSGKGCDMVGKLTNCGATTCHSGKNIWSAAVTMGDTLPLVVSGGADGKIAISGEASGSDGQELLERHSSNGNQSQVSDLNTTFTLDQITELIRENSGTDPVAPHLDRPGKAVKDGFLRYAFLSETTVLATSVSGRLFLGTATTSVAWEEIETGEAIRGDLCSYNVVKSPARDIAVVGGASGKIYLYRRSHGISELATFSGKITDIICLGGAQGVHQSPDAVVPESLTALVTVLGLNHAIMLKYNISTGESSQDPRTINFDDDYQNYAMTAALLCESTLVVGSRVGLLTLYSRSASSFDPIASRKDCKSKDSITCILPLPRSSTSFLTTCRDGRYRIYTLTGATTLTLEHEISPPLAILEGAWFTSTSPSELILYGFRGKNFVAWNETTRESLATLECGGAHRPFSYISAPADPGRLSLVFTKGATLRFFAQRRPELRTLQQGGHGREIRAVASCGAYVATAAEDTTVRIWEFREGHGFRCLAVLEKHTAGIQSLTWHGTGYLLSTAGNEELFVWRVTRLGPSGYDALAVVCEAVYPDRSADGDLRIMGLDVRQGEEGAMVIALVLSNSTVRTYRYASGDGFTLLATGEYLGACLTQVKVLGVESGGVQLLTASTDGHVVVWEGRRQAEGWLGLRMVLVERIHQSSVKSLSIAAVNFPPGQQRSWLVITGGDDNALGIMGLSWDGYFEARSKSRIKSAHAAAVTGTRVMQNKEGVVVATVSNDQRVKVWRVTSEDGNNGVERIQVAMLENRYSSVADPGDVEVIAPGRLMVGGVGMEVWEF